MARNITKGLTTLAYHLAGNVHDIRNNYLIGEVRNESYYKCVIKIEKKCRGGNLKLY